MNSHLTVWLEKPRFFMASTIVICLLAIKYFIADLIGNESVYLLSARKLIDPSFLSIDWSWSEKSPFGLNSLFSSLIVPLWLIVEDYIAIALIGRMLTWILFLYAVTQLSKEIGIKWYDFVIGLFLWIYTDQYLAAREWVIGGFEQKCVAYPFLIFSITALLRHQPIRAGVFCGVAISFHILVGGWGAIALVGALLFCKQGYTVSEIFRFLITMGCISLPIGLIAIRYMYTGFNIETVQQNFGDADSLIVFFAIPFHMDPNLFLDPETIISVVFICILTFFGITRTMTNETAYFLVSFLSVLLGFFIIGIIARQVNLLWFLKYYPFRVADVMIYLFFWLVLPSFVKYLFGSVRKEIDTGAHNFSRHKFFALVAALVLIPKILIAAPVFGSAVTSFFGSWLKYPTESDPSWVQYPKGSVVPSYDEMALWIKNHTEITATVITHPCGRPREGRFWIIAERSMIVNFKSIPHNHRIVEWYRRMKLLNGGHEFKTIGFGICRELDEHFHTLSVEKLLDLRKAYSADYYMTRQRRKELENGLIHKNKYYYLYDLRKS